MYNFECFGDASCIQWTTVPWKPTLRTALWKCAELYVWFPLVPHWDVLSIAWKCSKYRFWVCSNYFFWNPYLEHPRCDDFQIFFPNDVLSVCPSLYIHHMYIHYIYTHYIYMQYIPHYTTIIYTITLCIIPACDPNQAPLAPVAEAPSGSGFIAPWSKRLSERKKGAWYICL